MPRHLHSAGLHELRAEVTTQEAQAGLMLHPLTLPITVATTPIDNLTFSQRQPSLSGVITCLGPCHASGIDVTLTSAGGATVATTTALPDVSGSQEVRFSVP